MLTILKPSAWQFTTSSSGGIGVEFVVAEGGKIFLKDPTGNAVSFAYGGAGIGLAAGVKLPKIGKLQVNVKGKGLTGAIAPAQFPNGGKIYVLDSFSGTELTTSDLQGVCMFLEIGGGMVAGVSATAMLLGMSPVYLAACAAASALPAAAALLSQDLLNSATALLVMGGLNAGIQAGGGVGAYLGGLW